MTKRLIFLYFLLIVFLSPHCFDNGHENENLLAPASYDNYLANRDVQTDEYTLSGDIGIPNDYSKTIRTYQTLQKLDLAIPASYSWADSKKVTIAKDQGSCGGCWSFAAVGAIESKILIQKGVSYDLSEQQQLSCNNNMWGCSGGNMTSLRFWENLGSKEESCTGYSASNGNCSDLNGCIELVYRTNEYYTVTMSNREDIKKSIMNDGPAYFRFDVYSDFYSYWYYGAFNSSYTNDSSSREGGHAVLIIGWDDQKAAWLCKNSWGATAGPNGNGTFWISYGGHKNDLKFGMANCKLTSNVIYYRTPCEIPASKNNGVKVECCQ